MDESAPSYSILALGKKLVEELGLDQSTDTLGRWMAHYIAETIKDAEAATGEAHNRKMSECSDFILKLWAHRSNLPNGKRPFEDFEPIFRVLKSLDPDDATPHFFRQVRSAANQNNENESTTRWLDMASELDNAARMLIRYCLANAAQKAVDKSRDWVALADAITKEADIRVVLMLSKDVDDLNSEKPDDPRKSKIEDLLKRLDTFNDLSNKLSLHFRQQIEQTTS